MHVVDVGQRPRRSLRGKVLLLKAVGAIRVEEAQVEVGCRRAEAKADRAEGDDLERGGARVV